MFRLTTEEEIRKGRMLALRKAKSEYARRFPAVDFPEMVVPWWVESPEAIRAQIASGRPYVKEDAPAVDGRGFELTIERILA